jgi:hypothetical protein
MQGDEVLRNCAVLASPCSPGPFFNVTGSNADDPATDTTDWVYCCGTVSVGYSPFTGTIYITNGGTSDNCANVNDSNGNKGYSPGTTCYVADPGSIASGTNCNAPTGQICSQPVTTSSGAEYAFNADNAGTTVDKLTVTAPRGLPAALQFTVQKNDIPISGFDCTIQAGQTTCSIVLGTAVSFGSGDRTNIVISAPSGNSTTTSDEGVVISVQ